MRQRLLVIDHRAEIMAGMVPEFVGGLFYGASVKANSARLRGLQLGYLFVRRTPLTVIVCSHDKIRRRDTPRFKPSN
jgi:hypothetical protein